MSSIILSLALIFDILPFNKWDLIPHVYIKHIEMLINKHKKQDTTYVSSQFRWKNWYVFELFYKIIHVKCIQWAINKQHIICYMLCVYTWKVEIMKITSRHGWFHSPLALIYLFFSQFFIIFLTLCESFLVLCITLR